MLLTGVPIPGRWRYKGLGPSFKSPVRLQGQPVGGVRRPEKSENQGAFIYVDLHVMLQLCSHVPVIYVRNYSL